MACATHYCFIFAHEMQHLHDWILAIMVLCFVSIDLVMLVTFSAIEGAKGRLGAERELDPETQDTEEGVSKCTVYYVQL